MRQMTMATRRHVNGARHILHDYQAQRDAGVPDAQTVVGAAIEDVLALGAASAELRKAIGARDGAARALQAYADAPAPDHETMPEQRAAYARGFHERFDAAKATTEIARCAEFAWTAAYDRVHPLAVATPRARAERAPDLTESNDGPLPWEAR